MLNRNWPKLDYYRRRDTKKQVEDAYERADKLSEASGVQYTDRYGVVRNKEDTSLVGQILQRYCAAVNMEYK